MSTTEKEAVEADYARLTAAEKAQYRSLNLKNYKLRIYQGGFFVLFPVALLLLLRESSLFAICFSLIGMLSLEALINELIRTKIDRILFEKKVGFEKEHIITIRKNSIMEG